MSLGWVEFELFPIVFDLPIDGVTRLMGQLIARGTDLLIKASAYYALRERLSSIQRNVFLL